MSTCSIIIKIKDYFPKIDSIPYQNFICLFTNGENEGQIPLISKEDESYKHQMKNVLSDIKYKIHVLDYNDMSLIGMCEMVISYNIISQITPPNGFIQEQQKKLLMDTNTKRKLFGTVLNMGDIYLNIYSEIYLVEAKSNNNNINQKISNKKKIKLFGSEANIKKKLDGSPRTIQKKQLMMQINSDRRALININKNGNNTLDKKQKFKNITPVGKGDKNMTSFNINNNLNNNVKINSSFNYKDIIPQKKESKNNTIINKNNNVYKKINNNIKNKNVLKNKPKPNISKNNVIDKNNLTNNNNEKDRDKDKENNLFNYNIYSRYKTESNKNGLNSNLKSKLNKIEKKEKIQRNKDNKNFFKNSISPNLSSDNFKAKEEIPFDSNTGNKITTIESLENIDFTGKKYITKSNPTKKNNSQNNMAVFGNNTLFSTTSTEQEFNDMDKIILEKGTEIRNSFNNQLKSNKKVNLNNNINSTNLSSNNTNNSNTNNLDVSNNDNIVKVQTDIKNNFIKLIEFYSLLGQKLLKIRDKNDMSFKKNVIFKEQLFTELKKNNALTQKKTVAEVENFMNINNHGSLNEKFLRPMIKLKKLEFKIFQNIFNIFYYEYDILKYKEYENNKKMDENVKIELLLMVFKNLVKNYGNISQVYLSNNTKKTLLKNCLNKFGIEEKENGDWNMENNLENIPDNNNRKEKILEKNKNLEKNENKNDINKFKVIKEVDEEKEEEYDDEEKIISGNSEQISNNQISYSNSNVKENNFIYSKEKIKSDNKSIKNISGQKKLFENNEGSSTNKKENKLNDVKYNLSEKIIDHEDDIINNKNEKEDNMKESEQEKQNEIIDNQKENINNDEENKNDNLIDSNINNKEIIEEKIEEIDSNIIQKQENKKENNNDDKQKEIEIPLNDNSKNNSNKKDSQIKNIEKENCEEEHEIIEISDRKKEEMPKIPTKREVYTKKNRQRFMQKEPEQEQIQENNNIVSNVVNNEKTYFKKNRIKKEIYDEEDVIMQKILTEDFPKKCKEENRFVRISKNEYSFGEEKIKVVYKDGDVILKLDEGDYRIQEFIDILNEGKNEEENFDNENINEEKIEQIQEPEQIAEQEQEQIQNQEQIKEPEQIPEQEQEQKQVQEQIQVQEQEGINDNNVDEVLYSDKKENQEINDNNHYEEPNIEQKEINDINEINNNEIKENNSEKLSNKSLSSEKKHKKRRKKRVSEDNSFEKEITEKEENSENNKVETKGIVIEKENKLNNDNINYANKISNTEGNESDINSENKGRKYVIKRRRDYLQKKLK